MGAPRIYSKYIVVDGRGIVHGGITKDLNRRAQEHLRRRPSAKVLKVGRRTTEEAARRWERENGFA